MIHQQESTHNQLWINGQGKIRTGLETICKRLESALAHNQELFQPPCEENGVAAVAVLAVNGRSLAVC